jgi:hypothetical protein
MTHSIRPPKLATLLLRLFASEPDFPQIEGDLSEEFHRRLLATNPRAARRLYWRDTFRNLWALAKRLSMIQVLGVAALCVGVSIFTSRLLGDWLIFYIKPPTLALILLLFNLFKTAIVLILGILMSLLLRGRERLLRLAFTGFCLLYLMILGGHLLPKEPFLWGLNIIDWSLVVTCFWMGSAWMSRRRARRRAA